MKKFCSLSYVQLLFCLILSGIIVGCASLEEQKRIAECKARNSYNDGRSDAVNGLKSRFHFYNNRCEQYGVSLNENLYIKGYKKGIKKFCTYESAYQFGLKAGKYKNTCTTNKENFLKGYNEGDKECLYEAGYKDAVQGEKNNYAESSCVKISARPGQKQYIKGRAAGLKEFCAYKSAYQWGLNRRTYKGTCPAKKRAAFLKGYRAGDKKCLYEEGYSSAIRGETENFIRSACLKLLPHLSQTQYREGYRAGLKVFCVYKSGYQFGRQGNSYHNICPKNTEDKFFQGYQLGKKEYDAEKRHREKLEMERQRIAAERERAEAERAKAQALRDQAEAEWAKAQAIKDQTQVEWAKTRAIEEQTDTIKTQGYLHGHQLCNYRSDCHTGGKCVYISTIGERACRYNAANPNRAQGYELCHYNSDCHSGGRCVYISTLEEYACRY